MMYRINSLFQNDALLAELSPKCCNYRSKFSGKQPREKWKFDAAHDIDLLAYDVITALMASQTKIVVRAGILGVDDPLPC